jgi:hypothetical protein
MKLPYREFMMTHTHIHCFDDLVDIDHGSNKYSFKEIYETYYLEGDVEIYKYDDPGRLRIGFVIIDGNIREWHTVRLEAWSNGKTNTFFKEMNGE